MIILQHAPQMLQCTPPTGHVVTFYFQFLRVNKEKHIHLNYETRDIFVLDKCEITVDKNYYLLCSIT